MALRLSTPDTFPAFPYDEPYKIQLELMRHLYSCIEDRCMTVVESPTGTGKTASILSATLSWLQDDLERAKKGILNEFSSDDPTDWVSAQTVDRRRREIDAEEQEFQERLARARRKEISMKNMLKGRVVKRQKLTHQTEEDHTSEESFLPEPGTDQEDDNIHPRLRVLMQRLEKDNPSVGDNAGEPTCTKIYYASRTHSQLAQVIHELRKLRLAGFSLQVDHLEDEDRSRQLNIRTVPLASRKQLCVNEKLQKLGGDLDERCREMLGNKGDARCPYLPLLEEQLLDFRDQILATPKDIEDLVVTGKLSRTCPYFGSRRAIRQAQLVTLPYNLLLSKFARESLGIDLTNQIVVIDEAHNLVSALLSLSSTTLNSSTLLISITQLDAYLAKFRLRLTHKHFLHLQRLQTTLGALQKYISDWRQQHQHGKSDPGEIMEVMTVGELVLRMGRRTEGINLLEVNSYLKTSKIAKKIASYSEDASRRGTIPPLHTVEAFLMSLTTSSDDGRVSLNITSDQGQVEVRYHQLNPSSHFREVVESARSVILAGGTMSPILDVASQLFPQIPAEKLRIFSCGHIVPASNIQTLVLKKGPRGGDLLFKFQRRGDNTLLSELGQILLNLVNIVPAGMVIFFPSYHFLKAVQRVWAETNLLEKIAARKTVFQEPTDSVQVETILREFSEEIRKFRAGLAVGKKTGAILMAVIGAKLSEGLNFSDDLARAVVVVGLPFPNINSPELQERMKYVDKMSKEKGEQKDAGRELYENMCMNAVNQSIGRAIRHQRDWSSLILIDSRYSSSRIRDKLPKWISERTEIYETFGAAMKSLGTFYRGKRQAS